MHWLAHAMGLDNASGAWYLFWSGIFGDIGIFGAVFVYFHSRNCHVKGCLRVGRFSVDGTAWQVCRHHHPTIEDAPTPEQVAHDHREATA